MNLTELIRLFPSYIYYFFQVIDDHSLQSPFLFELYQETIRKIDGKGVVEFEYFRELLKNNNSEVTGHDPGAGSRATYKGDKTLGHIAKFSLSPKSTAHFLYLLVRHFQPETIIELGTSLGITTLYLAKGCEKGNVYTFEGNLMIATKALEIFNEAKAENIHLIKGDINETLPDFIGQCQRPVEFVFVDANHRKEAVLKYLNLLQPLLPKSAVLVIDDIRWSSEMYETWKQIIRTDLGQIYIDKFHFGVIFRRENFKKGLFCW